MTSERFQLGGLRETIGFVDRIGERGMDTKIAPWLFVATIMEM